MSINDEFLEQEVRKIRDRQVVGGHGVRACYSKVFSENTVFLRPGDILEYCNKSY